MMELIMGIVIKKVSTVLAGRGMALIIVIHMHMHLLVVCRVASVISAERMGTIAAHTTCPI